MVAWTPTVGDLYESSRPDPATRLLDDEPHPERAGERRVGRHLRGIWELYGEDTEAADEPREIPGAEPGPP